MYYMHENFSKLYIIEMSISLAAITAGFHTFLLILYYTFQVMDEIWSGPVGNAFREWFKQTKKLPEKEATTRLLAV